MRKQNHSKLVGLDIVLFVIFINWISKTRIVVADSKCADVQKKLTEQSLSPIDVAFYTSIFEALSQQTYSTPDNRFVLSICEKVNAKGIQNAAAGLVENSTAVVGLYNEISVDPVKTESLQLVSFRYKQGDKCLVNFTKQASIIALCDEKAQSPTLQFIGSHTCLFEFILVTSSICKVKRSSVAPVPTVTSTSSSTTAAVPASAGQEKSHMSAFSGFLLFLLVLALGYCVIGFLYKRFVLGARGAQQIPNYLFWIRICNSIEGCLANRSSNRYAGSSSRATDYDRTSADEANLIHDDESKYDQAPLAIGPGGGQTSTFRQQPLSVASSNTPSMNAQRQQRESLLSDDTDERLLQV